jgi:hypothetical protein
MKLLLLTAVAAVVFASLTDAALAKRRHPQLVPTPYASTYSYGPPMCASPYAVCSAGTYVGSDPDPQVRAQMLVDFNRGVYATGTR